MLSRRVCVSFVGLLAVAVLLSAAPVAWGQEGEGSVYLPLVSSDTEQQSVTASSTATTLDCNTENIRKSPYGAISAVYFAYEYRYTYEDGLLLERHPLGNPVSCEKDFHNIDQDGNDIGFNLDQDKFQEFEHGSIYYNSSEKTAFALFNKLDAQYKDARKRFGFPISSEIGDSQKGTCRGYFDNGYITCDGNEIIWSGNTTRFSSLPHYLPLDMTLPYTGTTVSFNSSLHSWDYGGEENFGRTVDLDTGSGLDFSGNRNVIAVTAGTVIFVDTNYSNGCGFDGGCIAIRSDFSGIVIVYGHIQAIEKLEKGSYVKQGDIIGKDQNPKGGTHVHLELRDGQRNPITKIDGLSRIQPNFGNPLSWDGVIIDGYLFSPFREANSPTTSNEPNLIYNYDGAALNVASLLKTDRRYSFEEQITILPKYNFNFGQCFDRGLYVWSWKTPLVTGDTCIGRQSNGEIVYSIGIVL